jgi:hypothetical protein
LFQPQWEAGILRILRKNYGGYPYPGRGRKILRRVRFKKHCPIEQEVAIVTPDFMNTSSEFTHGELNRGQLLQNLQQFKPKVQSWSTGRSSFTT